MAKMELVLQYVGGVMFWEFGWDVFNEYFLLEVVSCVMWGDIFVLFEFLFVLVKVEMKKEKIIDLCVEQQCKVIVWFIGLMLLVDMVDVDFGEVLFVGERMDLYCLDLEVLFNFFMDIIIIVNYEMGFIYLVLINDRG